MFFYLFLLQYTYMQSIGAHIPSPFPLIICHIAYKRESGRDFAVYK